jgi:molecular chaperone GrpE
VNETNHAEGTVPADASPPGGADAALAAAEAKATENRNNYLRAVAEMDNFRKRSERDIENARKFAIERFAQELVTVGDALEAGINAGAANPGPALLEGAQATLRQLHSAFDKGGTADCCGRHGSSSVKLPGTAAIEKCRELPHVAVIGQEFSRGFLQWVK